MPDRDRPPRRAHADDSAAVGRIAYDGQGGWRSVPLDRALVARQQSTIDVLADFGEIPGGRVSADGSVDFRFDTHPAT